MNKTNQDLNPIEDYLKGKFKNRSKGANNLQLKINNKQEEKNITFKKENSSMSLNDTRIAFNCYETIEEWIPKQNQIFGCMYNLADFNILKLLQETNYCSINVNYSDWMNKDNIIDKEKRDKVFKLYSLIGGSILKLQNKFCYPKDYYKNVFCSDTI